MLEIQKKTWVEQCDRGDLQGDLHRQLHTAFDKMSQNHVDAEAKDYPGKMVRTYSVKLSELGINNAPNDALPLYKLLAYRLFQAPPDELGRITVLPKYEDIIKDGEIRLQVYISKEKYDQGLLGDPLHGARINADDLLFDIQTTFANAKSGRYGSVSYPNRVEWSENHPKSTMQPVLPDKNYFFAMFDADVLNKYHKERNPGFHFDDIIAAICKKNNIWFHHSAPNAFDYIEEQHGRAVVGMEVKERKIGSNNYLRSQQKEFIIGHDPELQRVLSKELGVKFPSQQREAQL